MSFAQERARKEVCEVTENHRIDPQYEELDEAFWWVLVHVEMQGYYVEIFSAEFENLLTELRDAVIPMLHTEYVQMLNGKRE